MNKPPKRPFPSIPRQVLTAGAVTGGIIGILLSEALRWSAAQGFIFTLLIAGVCVLIAAVLYSALADRRTR